MKKFIYLIISIINSGIIAICLALSPYVVLPMHYDINGNADRYGSKWEIMIYTAIPIAIGIAYLIYSTITKNKENKNKKLTEKIFFIFFIFVILLLWYIAVLCLQCKPHMSNSNFAVISVIIGGALLAVSNFMPKARQNTIFGIKTKSTLSSPTVWNKTHRLAGILGVIGSMILMICGIIGIVFAQATAPIFFIGVGTYLILGIITPCIYAHIIYKKEKSNS